MRDMNLKKWSWSHDQDGHRANIENLYKFLLWNQKFSDLQGLKVYKVYINDDPVLTLTYFTARSNLVKIAYCAYTRPIVR